MLTPSYRGRFAPSPTGPLHLGSLLAALGSWLFARHAGGRWLIRIDDIDPPREVPGAAAQQLATLAAFGLHSDEPVLYQSQRGELYAQALQQLLEDGHAFACRCSRSDLEASAGRHLGACVNHDPLRPTAIRLAVPEASLCFFDAIQGPFQQNLRVDVGDVVLRRADGFWAYQLAAVVDDADCAISHVVRGSDLLDSTPRQIWLQSCLRIDTPSYAHLPLVTDSLGRKLSKSLSALPINDTQPLPALCAAWSLLGQTADLPNYGLRPEVWLEHALSAFDAALIPKTTPAFLGLSTPFSAGIRPE